MVRLCKRLPMGSWRLHGMAGKRLYGEISPKLPIPFSGWTVKTGMARREFFSEARKGYFGPKMAVGAGSDKKRACPAGWLSSSSEDTAFWRPVCARAAFSFHGTMERPGREKIRMRKEAGLLDWSRLRPVS